MAAAERTAFQVAVLDLSVTFTWKEMGQLDQAQRSLFWEVMLDTCSLVSLGLAGPKPEFI
uniref:KRAB domain-containing protein n=1 Tax=Rhinolophus ferrumequinum TaxID=59479 RepID=A0A671DVV2_RHIFE